MCPILFHIGSIPIYGFGLMLAAGFITGSYLLTSEYNRLKINMDVTSVFIMNVRIYYVVLLSAFFITFVLQNSDPRGQSILEFATSSSLHILIFMVVIGIAFYIFRKPRPGSFDLANTITFYSLLYGVTGSKLLFVLENISSFVSRPFDTLFSAGGLTYFGGFLLVVIIIYFTTRKAHISFLQLTDATAPGLMIGYGIARIGCHLAGDGDYGFPTTLPWGTDYSKGTFPPSAAFQDFPEITSQFPHGIVPDNIPCHPTPIYEFIICALMFWFLWRIRKKMRQPGLVFMIYLCLAGIERFAIEFLRPNPRILFGLSEAQLVSLILIVVGMIGWKKISASHPDHRE